MDTASDREGAGQRQRGREAFVPVSGTKSVSLDVMHFPPHWLNSFEYYVVFYFFFEKSY